MPKWVKIAWSFAVFAWVRPVTSKTQSVSGQAAGEGATLAGRMWAGSGARLMVSGTTHWSPVSSSVVSWMKKATKGKRSAPSLCLYSDRACRTPWGGVGVLTTMVCGDVMYARYCTCG